ncbi:DUF309 domain-containing protein [Paenibacillus motobuensis]|uniref:DUF309 domain-containing protein n=1 Tax=Paenibacillus TaxID=44249 RepID=UPI0020407430|nr:MULTISPECIES: DUF309 domain-containing protein [Paenibacillus]MCM3038509.1 DUF309 domain-containing protein [Paenibacillus lutimineralis]MCM3645613.1 DUF309 domain-containing protein [Paenibacillus motobuensis]
MKNEPLYLAFLVYFNRDRDYFECHEVMEELWLAQESDPLYKGLLQIAVGLFHFRYGNVVGARKMLLSAVDRLKPYPIDSLGIDLGKLRSEAALYAAKLEAYEQNPFTHYDLTIDIIDPELREAVEQASAHISPNIPQRRRPMRGPKHEQRRQG